MMDFCAPEGIAPELRELAQQVVRVVRDVEHGLGHGHKMLERLFCLDPRELFLRAAGLELQRQIARHESMLARLREALRAVEEAAAAAVGSALGSDVRP